MIPPGQFTRLADRMTIVENEVFQAELSGYAKLLYVALLVFRNNDTKLCWPARQTLAHMISASPRTVQRALDELEAIGYLRKEPRTREDGGQTSNLYHVLGPYPYI